MFDLDGLERVRVEPEELKDRGCDLGRLHRGVDDVAGGPFDWVAAHEDWNVSVLVVRSNELKPKTLGNIHWDTDKKTAIIRVLDPAEYQMPFREMLDDMEFTVVHELIHLELAPALSQFSRNDASRREEEHAVNHMAAALLKLDHGK